MHDPRTSVQTALSGLSLEVKMSWREAIVYIMGPDRLSNELLAYYLTSQSEFKCKSLPDNFSNKLLDNGHPLKLILRDCHNLNPDNPWGGLGVGARSHAINTFLAIFNVSRGLGIEKKALKRNIRGIFFKGDSPETLRDGIKAILKGELWYPREALKWVMDPSFNSSEPIAPLTVREREILVCLSSGACNDEIADHLHISPHTVKNHITNIYKKINVPNRLQACMWAAKNL